MRNKNNNRIENVWKKLNSEQKKTVNADINRAITTEARSGKFRRDGQMESGALQLFNLIESDYIRFGSSFGGSTVGT